MSPELIGLASAVLVTVTSGFCATSVVSVSLLFAVFGSKVVVVTVAVFDRVPEADPETATTIVIVAEAPGARSGTLHVTVDVPEQLTPAEPVDETRVVFAGKGSDTLMPLAVLPVEAVLVLVTVML